MNTKEPSSLQPGDRVMRKQEAHWQTGEVRTVFSDPLTSIVTTLFVRWDDDGSLSQLNPNEVTPEMEMEKT